MNEILNKVQNDLSKLQQTLEREGEVLLGKIKKAATNKKVVAKRKEFEKLVENQIEKFEPAFEKFYKQLKSNAVKYGVNLEKIEKQVREKTKTARGKTGASTKKKAASGSTASSSTTAAPKKKAAAPAAETKSAVGGTKKTKKKATSSKKA